MSTRNEERDITVRNVSTSASRAPIAPLGNIMRMASDERPFTSGIYLRPNRHNQGTIPATDLCYCPDIWIAGIKPIHNHTSFLATADEYGKESDGEIVSGHANYVYLRGKNGSQLVQNAKLRLYVLPNAVVQWPSNWTNAKLPTDASSSVYDPIYDSEITALAAGEIGVARNCFIWENPGPVPEGSDHYCFVAWVDDGTNPLPSQDKRVQLSDLLVNNLKIGWRNVGSPVGIKSDATFLTNLSVSSDLVQPDPLAYRVEVRQSGFPENTDGRGWKLDLSASTTDYDGKEIRITRDMPNENTVYGKDVKLQRGWGAAVTVSLSKNQGPDLPKDSEASIVVSLIYPLTESELQEALDLRAVDFPLTNAIFRADRQLPIKHWARLGSDRFKAVDSRRI